jgi:hypothetical protein
MQQRHLRAKGVKAGNRRYIVYRNLAEAAQAARTREAVLTTLRSGVSPGGRLRHHAMPVSIGEIDHQADDEPRKQSQPGIQRQTEHQQQ